MMKMDRRKDHIALSLGGSCLDYGVRVRILGSTLRHQGSKEEAVLVTPVHDLIAQLANTTVVNDVRQQSSAGQPSHSGTAVKPSDVSLYRQSAHDWKHSLGDCLSTKEVTFIKSTTESADSLVEDERLSGEDAEANSGNERVTEISPTDSNAGAYKGYQFRPLGIRNPTAISFRRGEPREVSSIFVPRSLVAVGMPCPSSTFWPSAAGQRLVSRTQDNTQSSASYSNKRPLGSSIGVGLTPAPLTARTNTIVRKDSQSLPAYVDPFVGAAAVFQQRVAELAVLEADTIKYERTKKLVRIKAKTDQ